MLDRIMIPAGRSVRRDGTAKIEPTLTYGYLQFYVLSHELYELSEATFTEVLEEPTGRTYVLDFKGSREKFFRANLDDELRNLADINGYLQIRGYYKGTMPIVPRIPRWPLNAETVEASAAKLAVLWAREGVLDTIDPTDSLVNQLTDPYVFEYVAPQDDLYPALKAVMPHDFNFPNVPTKENILAVLQSPQFRDAIVSLEELLQRRALSPDLIYELGLRIRDGWNYNRFLRALHRLRPRLDSSSYSECVADIEDDCHCDTCEPPPDFSSSDVDDDESEFNDSEDGRSADERSEE